MKVLIAGSRNFADKELLFAKMDELNTNNAITYVISGRAIGADRLGEEWAIERNIPILKYPAEWDIYGNRAGMIRNSIMGKECDIAVVFWDGSSNGTRNMISIIKDLKKPLKLYKYLEKEEDEW